MGSGLTRDKIRRSARSRTSPPERAGRPREKPTARGLAVFCGVAGPGTSPPSTSWFLWKGGSLFTNDGSVADKVLGDVLSYARSALFAGYLMAVPVTVLCARVVGPPINHAGLPLRRAEECNGPRDALLLHCRGEDGWAWRCSWASGTNVGYDHDWPGSLEFPGRLRRRYLAPERTYATASPVALCDQHRRVHPGVSRPTPFIILTTRRLVHRSDPPFAMTKTDLDRGGDPVELLSKLEKGGRDHRRHEFSGHLRHQGRGHAESGVERQALPVRGRRR